MRRLIIMIVYYLLMIKVNAHKIYTIGLNDEYQSSLTKLLDQESYLVDIYSLNNFEDLNSITPDSINGLISFSQNDLERLNLEMYSEEYGIPHLTVARGLNKNITFFTDLSEECYSKTVSSIAEYFSMIRPSMIWTYTEDNLNIIERMKTDINFEFSHLSFIKNLPVSSISTTLSKTLKPQGTQHFIFLPDLYHCQDLIKAFHSSYLEQKGNIAVLFTSCLFQSPANGSLVLSEDLFNQVQNSEDFKILQLKKFLQVFSTEKLKKSEILEELKKVYSNLCKFSIINIQAGKRKIVGIVENGKIQVNSTIEYLGGVNDLENFTSPSIVVSANTGSFNPNGLPRAYSNVGYHQGTYFAVDKINKDKEYFPYHTLKLYDKVDCGVSVFDFNYSKECFLRHRPEMGVSYVPTFFPVTLSALKQLTSFGQDIPFIGGIGSSGLLSNKSEYPYFVRTVSPSTDFAVAWANLIRLYGWSNLIVHYSNDGFAGSAYKILNKSQETYNFRIINDEKYRMVDYILNYESIFNYYDHIKNSMSLGCNIIFLILGDPAAYFWLEGFYDMGARRGDFTFILFANNGLSNFDAVNANVKKRKELMHGTLVIYNGAWVGEYGQIVKKEYLEEWKDPWGRSHFIDAVLAAARTTKFLMEQGKSFETAGVFMHALRNIRFLGTTGTISFDSGSNDRNINYFNIFNFFEDSSGKWHDDAVALISPLGTVYYSVLQPTIWSNGELPKSMKENYLDCPFRKDQIQSSSSGVNIKISLSIAILLISTVLTIYSLKVAKIKRLQMLTSKVQIVFEDYLTLTFILIEFLQLLSIGPSFISFNEVLSNISEIFSLNISKIAKFEKTTFWVIFASVLIISYLWLILLSVTFFKLTKRYPILTEKLNELETVLFPIITNFFFVPILVCLMSILKCDKAIGDRYYESYLNYDCGLFCWKDEHIAYSVLACFQLVAYIPIAILYRTVWQEDNDSINVKTHSLYLIIKNISVVVLVIVSKILKDDYQLLYNIIYIVITLALLVQIIIIKHPFNYDRANLWCKVFLVCVIWNSFICLIENLALDLTYALVVLQMGGWTGIFVVGFRVQKKLPENLLVSMKGRSVVDLFRFAFGVQSFRKTIYFVKEVEGFTDIKVGNEK